MNSTTSCILAVVIVLIVLIVAVSVHRRYSKSGGKSSFMPGDAATPKLREAVALLSGDLNCISRVADSVNGRGKKIEATFGSIDMGPAFNEARLSLTGARQGMGEIVHSVKRLKSTVNTMTPTYQNVLGLYRGLRDSDKALWEAAKALDLAGDRMQDLVSSTGGSPDHTNTGQPATYVLHQELGSAASQLRQMSSCFYSLVRSVHYLGSALQLE
jgi:hypothetical protein